MGGVMVIFPVVLGGEWGNQREREGPGLGLKQLPLAKPTQQPTKNNTSDGAGIFD
jgi:hypothetical protein